MMKSLIVSIAMIAITSFISVGCRMSRGPATATVALAPAVPPAEKFDFMGCRQNASGCDVDCTKKSGVSMEAPDICPKGGFEGSLACFCEKDPVR